MPEEEQKKIDFSEWLKSQAEDIQAAFGEYTAGLQSALKKERDDRKALEKAQKDAAELKAAEEKKRLEEQGQYKALAEEAARERDAHAARVKELEPLAETVKRQGEALKRFLDEERKGLPKHVLTLLDKLDPVDQLEYIAANRAELRPAGGGGPRSPATVAAAAKQLAAATGKTESQGA